MVVLAALETSPRGGILFGVSGAAAITTGNRERTTTVLGGGFNASGATIVRVGAFPTSLASFSTSTALTMSSRSMLSRDARFLGSTSYSSSKASMKMEYSM